uniref:Switching B cell complex subunit SWAP70b n=1 Tax=Neogobius melanostomus TaxID=47308 RepID=A0A8C6T3J8_9GOBI
MSRDELLKPIWHAFTALDVDRSGKVSKSQLKVLSHNLCTVLKVPHDPVSLEEHFKDDDEGPVSNQGYMPYLSTFILDKVNFNRLELNHMCWTLCCKKNLDQSQLQVSEYDAFKLWCIFNFLSEEHYPLVLVSQEVLQYYYYCSTTATAILLLGRLEQYQKLENATNKTKTWKHKVAEHEGLLRLIQPGTSTTLLTTTIYYYYYYYYY